MEMDKVTRLHCLVLRDRDTGERISCTDNDPNRPSIAHGIALLTAAEEIAGHNIICYDIPVIERLFKLKLSAKVVDTLVLCRLIWSDIADDDMKLIRAGKMPGRLLGGHGLEAWGYRIGVYKDDFHHETDWQHWSPEMQAYCEQDVEVNENLLVKIEKRNYAPLAIWIEHRFRQIIFKQEQNGFCFNEKKAVALYEKLLKRQQELTAELQSIFPPRVIEGKTPEWYAVLLMDEVKCRYPTKGACQDWLKRNVFPASARKAYSIVPGPNKTKLDPFNPSSRPQIVERLKEKYGWVPTEFTENGGVAVDDDVLASLTYPEAKLIAELFMVEKRLGQVATGKQAWLRLVRNGRIHGRVNTNGAVTGRCTHSGPNVAQTPACDVPYGPECRDLWEARPGWELTGTDGEGLELRCLAHFMAKYDNGAYADTVVNGKKEDKTDVHNVNARALELSRNDAKTWIYRYLYGGGDELLGSSNPPTQEEIVRYQKTKTRLWAGTVKMLVKRNARLISKGENHKTRKITPMLVATIIKGAELRERFEERTPALAKLRDAVALAVEERGNLRGMDGRILRVRSKMAALNTLLQSAGAVAMKLATIIFVDDMAALGYEQNVIYALVAHIHDEFQTEHPPELRDIVVKTAKDAIRKAGEQLGFRCPLAGSASTGKTWKETH